METKSIERQQQENIEAVKGTVVKVWNEKSGKWSTKTARILDYCVPLVWKLDRPIYGTEFYHDNFVRTLNEKRLGDLVPEPK